MRLGQDKLGYVRYFILVNVISSKAMIINVRSGLFRLGQVRSG